MVRVRPKMLALVGAGVATMALGIAVPAMAFAQDPTPTGTATSAGALDADHDRRLADRRDRMVELLAEELGLSKDQVASALEKVETQLREEARADHQAALKERLDAAVADGKLTREQADAVLAAVEAGVLGGPGRPGGHGPGHRGPGN